MFSQRNGVSSFHELLLLPPLFPFSHDAHGRRTRRIPLQLLLQLLLLSCACERSLGLSPTCVSHTISNKFFLKKSQKSITFKFSILVSKDEY